MTPRRTWGAAALIAASLLLAGCSWRMETPPPVWPSPDEATLMRDAAAEREQAVIDAVVDSAGAGTPQAVVLEEIEGAAAPLRLEALGGVYVAYPSASPSPGASAVPTDVMAAVTQARDGHLADALVATDQNLAELLTAAGLSHALSSWYAVWVDDRIAGASLPVVDERLLASTAIPEPALLPAAASTTDATVIGDLALEHDRARYAYEVMGAASTGEERAQWLARRDLQDARASELTMLPGVEDQRAAVYVLTADQSADSAQRLATAIAIENGLGATYAALAAGASAPEKAWLLSAAFDAYAQAAAYGEARSETYAVPALPGLEPGGAE